VITTKIRKVFKLTKPLILKRSKHVTKIVIFIKKDMLASIYE
tara:strand:- start:498 stop:623 length:126 start_codon:yes stop_codon:yes gene_type:complete